MIGEEVKALLWKELTDLMRDKKTIITSLLMPLLIFPMLGLISIALMGVQEIKVAIVDLDRSTCTNELLNITVSSKDLVNELMRNLLEQGYRVELIDDLEEARAGGYDLIIIIPKGFSCNASSTTSVARITIMRRVGVQAAARAESIVNSIIDSFSRRLSIDKINGVVRLARINATIESLLYPVSTKAVLIGVGGRVVSFVEEFRSFLARILVLALSVVVTPATSFIIDGIIGERERKTIEMLLSTPARLSTILCCKLMAASLLGLLTAVADAIGLVIYIGSLTIAYSGMIMLLDPTLLAIHSIVAFFTILVTVSIALPFITRTRGIRSASNIASLVAIAGTIMFFTGFMVDYTKIRHDLRMALYIVPYTHSILAIQEYVLGYQPQSAIHIIVLIVISLALIGITIKTLDTEKVLLAPPS